MPCRVLQYNVGGGASLKNRVALECKAAFTSGFEGQSLCQAETAEGCATCSTNQSVSTSTHFWAATCDELCLAPQASPPPLPPSSPPPSSGEPQTYHLRLGSCQIWEEPVSSRQECRDAATALGFGAYALGREITELLIPVGVCAIRNYVAGATAGEIVFNEPMEYLLSVQSGWSDSQIYIDYPRSMANSSAHSIICRQRSDHISQILIGGLDDWLDANAFNSSSITEPAAQISSVTFVTGSDAVSGDSEPLDIFGFATPSAAANAIISVQGLAFERPTVPDSHIVTTELTVDGDVDSFDKAAFRANVLQLFAGASDVLITVAPGSVVVTTSVVYADPTGASAAAAQIAGSSPSALSSSLGVNVTAATPPTVAVEAAVPPPSLGISSASLPTCADGTIVDGVTGVSSPICGPQAICTDERLSALSSTTTPRCSCPSDGYALVSAGTAANLAPYSTGCVVATQASKLRMRQDTDSLTLTLHKRQTFAERIGRNLTLSFRGTDPTSSDLVWRVASTPPAWLTVLTSVQSVALPAVSNGRLVDTGWEDSVPLIIDALGLGENTAAYETTLVIEVDGQADRNVSTDIFAYIVAEPVAAQVSFEPAAAPMTSALLRFHGACACPLLALYLLTIRCLLLRGAPVESLACADGLGHSRR